MSFYKTEIGMNTKRVAKRRFWVLLGAAAVVAGTAHGQVDWVAQKDDWHVAGNWSGNAVPSNVLARITNGGTAVIGEDVPQVLSVYVGCIVASTAYSGTVLQTNGMMSIAGGMYPLLIGFNNTTGYGLYDISGGCLSVTGGVFIGSAASRPQTQGTGTLVVRGDGAVTHTNGVFCVAHYGRTGTVVLADNGSLRLNSNPLLLGYGPSENIGTLEMTGGTLAAPRLEMAGESARAFVNVSGGSLWLNAMTAGSGVADVLLKDCAIGTFSADGVWSAPMTLDGTVTFYTGDAQGVPRVNAVTGLLPSAAAIVIEHAPGQVEAGQVILGGTGAFADSITVNGGNAVGFASQEAIDGFPNAVTFTAGGQLVFASDEVVTNNLTVAGLPESVVQNGTGILVLTNAQSVFGTAIVNNGAIRFASAAAIPGIGESIIINAGGAVTADGAYPTLTAWLDSGRIATDSRGALALAADSSEAIDLTTAGGGAYENLSLGALGDIVYSGMLTPINDIYRLGGGNGTLTYASAITHGSVVVDSGEGSVVLAAGNTFGGGITIASGTLQAAHPDALGSGELMVSNGVFQVNSAVNASGGIVVTNTGLVQVGPGGSVDGPTANHAYNNFNTQGLIFNGADDFTHTGDVSGTGLLAVIGDGTLHLGTPGQVIEQNNVFVGNYGSAGHLEMSGGTLSVADWLIVACGAERGTPLSTFTLSGGTVTKTGGATLVGDRSTAGYPAEGRMTLGGDGVFRSMRGDFTVGYGSGTGVLAMDGGEFVHSNGIVFVGSNGTGTVNLADGEMKLDQLYVGNQGTIGTFNQTGGVLGRINPTDGGERFRIGNMANSVGVFNLSGGSVDTGRSLLWVGASGHGTLNQSGGTMRCDDWLIAGRYARSVGVYNLSGGEFFQTRTEYGLIVGEAGTGTLTVSGTGAMYLDGGDANSLGLIVGHSAASSTGRVNLVTGGLISTKRCLKYGNSSLSYGEFNFDGGTLQVRRNNSTVANFMQGLSAAYVREGGAVFDVSNNVVTVAQGLQSGAAADGGLTKLGSGTLILTGTNTYNGLTTISDGTLRLGHVEALLCGNDVLVNSGRYDLGGNTVTNGTVTLENGTVLNGTIHAAFDVPGSGELFATLVADSSLTKSGDGMLTLYSPPQQYAGKTRVSGGTLQLAPVRSAIIHYDFEAANVNGDTVRNLGTGGPAYDGIMYGSPPFTDGIRGQAVTIANASRAVVTASPVPLTNAFTFAAWVKALGTSGSYQRIIHNTYQNGGYLGTDNNNRFLGVIKGKDLTASAQSSSDTAQWHHAAMVWDGETMRLYYDGTVIHTKTYLGTDASFTSPIAFGHNIPSPGLNSEFWNGLLDEVYVFDSALTPSEISSLCHFNSGADGLLPAATTLELTNDASVALGEGMSQTVAALTGDGAVTGGVLTVTGIVAPGGDANIGTLTVSGDPVLTGTLQIDADATDADRLVVLGAVDLSQLTLDVMTPNALDRQTDYEIISCAPGALTGTFQDIIGLPSGWYVRYDRTHGKVILLSIKGTLILVR